jgi:MarR family transcriptional regulator, repressor for mepA
MRSDMDIEKFNIDHPFQFYLRSVLYKMKLSADKHLEPYNISGPQARIVGFIGEEQEKGITVCQKDIETVMGISGASVTNLLQGLERKGFIRRIRSATDERIKELSLTPKGKELIDTFRTVFDDMEKIIGKGMSDEEKALFLQLLQKANHNFRK